MTETPILIYCAGGNKRFARIAIEEGFRYGARLPCRVHYPIFFADQDWKNPDRRAYMVALERHRPSMATVLDWEREDQLPEVLEWAEEATKWVERVVIIPKVPGGVPRIPRTVGSREVVLGYSVPTKYGATDLPIEAFAGWPVHLLGGSPEAQIRIHRRMTERSRVVSVDGNYSQRMARYGKYWSVDAWREGRGCWESLMDVRAGDKVDKSPDMIYRTFRKSCRNIRMAWEEEAWEEVEEPPEWTGWGG